MNVWRIVLLSNKLIGYLGLLKKGDYLIIGADKIKETRKKMFLIIIPSNPSKNIEKVSSFKANDYNIPIIKLKNANDLGEAIGINNCKILGVKNKGLCDAILKNCSDEFEILER